MSGTLLQPDATQAAPAPARTLRVFTYAPVVSQVPLTWHVKDPEDTLDFALDLLPSFLAGETILTAIMQPTPAELLVSGAFLPSPHVLAFWCAGGVSGSSYRVSFLVETSEGHTLHFSAVLPVLVDADPTVAAVG